MTWFLCSCLFFCAVAALQPETLPGWPASRPHMPKLHNDSRPPAVMRYQFADRPSMGDPVRRFHANGVACIPPAGR